MIRILIVESQHLFRVAWRALLATQPGMIVVGEAASLTEACQSITTTAPDLLLVSSSLRTERSEFLARMEELKQQSGKRTKVLLLTNEESPEYLQNALTTGIAGLIATSATVFELTTGIRAVHDGRFVLNASSRPNSLAEHSGSMPDAAISQLSDRERMVLALLVEGHTNKEIAARLDLSIKTVETYRSRLCSKLNLRSRSQLVQFCFQHGLLSIPATLGSTTPTFAGLPTN